MNRTETIPVTVLTGFLGAGKTTLINRLLKERPGTRFGLVVNEFGEASLETQLLESRRQPLQELPSGCLCCVSDGDLKGALDALVVKDVRIGHILVEASGLSSPGPLLGLLTQDEGRYRLSGVFCIVDATSFLDHEKNFSSLGRQLRFADALILTKTDLVEQQQIDLVRQRLAQLRPGLHVLDSSDRLPWSVLFESATLEGFDTSDTQEREPQRRFFQGGRHHGAQVFEFVTHRPLNPDRLRLVFAHLHPGILRAKGILFLDEPSAVRYKYLVQYTGTQKQLYSRQWLPGEPRQTSLVFLGTSFDVEALRSQLQDCLEGELT